MPRSLLLLAALSLAACASGPVGPVTETGSLEVGDMTLQSGEYYDRYEMRASEGQWITMRVEADGFDPYIILASPSQEQSERDDSEEGNTTSVEMTIQADEAGTWSGLVTSYAPGETGSYTLTYEVSDTQPLGGAMDAPEAEGSEMEMAEPTDDEMDADAETSI